MEVPSMFALTASFPKRYIVRCACVVPPCERFGCLVCLCPQLAYLKMSRFSFLSRLDLDFLTFDLADGVLCCGTMPL